MEMTRIIAFTDAMKRKDIEGMLTHMADDVVLNTPLASEPVRGKAARTIFLQERPKHTLVVVRHFFKLYRS